MSDTSTVKVKFKRTANIPPDDNNLTANRRQNLAIIKGVANIKLWDQGLELSTKDDVVVYFFHGNMFQWFRAESDGGEPHDHD